MKSKKSVKTIPPGSFDMYWFLKKKYFFAPFWFKLNHLVPLSRTTTHKFYFNYYTPLAWIKMILLLFFNYLYLINTISLYRNNRFMLDEMDHQNTTNETNSMARVFILQYYSKFWRVSLGNFIKYIPPISEGWLGDSMKSIQIADKAYRKGSMVVEYCFWTPINF